MKGSVSFLPVNHDPWADLPKGPTEARQGPMSWTDYLPFVKEAIKIYGKEKLGEILGAVTAPGEALAGRLDPGTPEGLRRVQALAGLAMGGPAKPSGAIGAGWQFPTEKFLKNAEVPNHFSAEVKELAKAMKDNSLSSPIAAAHFLGKHKDVAKSVEDLFVPKAEYGYLHPHDAPLSEHPATYGMSEPEARAASELLEALKLYPDQYKSPKEAVQGLEEFAEPHELPHFESAAKKLEDWAGPHGFKFEEAPSSNTVSLLEQIKKDNEKFANEQAQALPSYVPTKTVPIPEALYPINWADLHSAVARPGQTASGEYADTLRRAESLGFNTNFPLYHGAFETKVKAPENPAEGLWGPEAEKYHAFAHPATTKDFEPGIFTTDTPEIAQLYSGGSDAPLAAGQTFPLFANPKKTLALDWNAISSNPSYSGPLMDLAIKEARKRGAEALVIQGMQDVGGPQNQYIFLEPNVLRSMFARFDPAHLASANLTRSGGLPMFIPVDHDPFKEQNQ